MSKMMHKRCSLMTLGVLAGICIALAAGSASAGQTISNQTFSTTQSFTTPDFVTVSHCTFQNISGAALTFTNVNTVTIVDCTFTNITTSGIVGAIGANGCDLINVNGCDFYSNTGTVFRLPNVADASLSASTKNLTIIIDDVTIDGVTGDGMNIFQSDSLTITNSTIANCSGWGAKLGRNADYAGTNGYLHALDFSHNVVHDIMADGILGGEPISNAVICDNEIYNIATDGAGARPTDGDHGLYWQGPGAVICDNYVHDVYDGVTSGNGGLGISYRTNVTVTRNIVCDIMAKDGIAYWSDHAGSGTSEISNNVVYNCARHAFCLAGALGSNNPNRYEIDRHNIYHNTFYHTATNADWTQVAPVKWYDLSQPCSIYFTGNIIALDNGDSADHYIVDGASAPTTIIPYNTWPGQEGQVYINQNIKTPLNYTLSSMFMDYANRDFHLKAGSPAIDFVTGYDVVTVDADGNTRPGGGANDAGAYEYQANPTAPTLSSINPSSGPAAGGTACTLTGTNFLAGATVSFGGTAATGVTVDSSTQIRCTSPAKSAGTYGVTVTTSNGTSNAVNFVYNPPAPTLSAIAPTSGSTAGGTACTLTGTNLTGCSAVSFGGTAGTSIVVDSATQVRCASPAKTAGTYSVTATTGGGTSNGVNFTYNQGGGTTTTLYSGDDARVDSASTNTNFGTTTLIAQKNSTKEIATYIKFDLNSVTGTSITSATLRLCRSVAGTATTEKVYSCSTDTWTEGTLKWSNKPAWGTQQTSFTTPSAANTWVAVDITSYISANFSGDKLVTLVLRDDQNLNVNVQYYSDETGAAGGYRPQLIVVSQ